MARLPERAPTGKPIMTGKPMTGPQDATDSAAAHALEARLRETQSEVRRVFNAIVG